MLLESPAAPTHSKTTAGVVTPRSTASSRHTSKGERSAGFDERRARRTLARARAAPACSRTTTIGLDAPGRRARRRPTARSRRRRRRSGSRRARCASCARRTRRRRRRRRARPRRSDTSPGTARAIISETTKSSPKLPCASGCWPMTAVPPSAAVDEPDRHRVTVCRRGTGRRSRDRGRRPRRRTRGP